MPNDIPEKYPKQEGPLSDGGELGESAGANRAELSPEELEKRGGEIPKETGEVVEGQDEIREAPQELGPEAKESGERSFEEGAESAEDLEKAIAEAQIKFAELNNTASSSKNSEELDRLKQSTGDDFKKLARTRGFEYAMGVAEDTKSDFIIDVAHAALAEEQNKKPLY